MRVESTVGAEQSRVDCHRILIRDAGLPGIRGAIRRRSPDAQQRVPPLIRIESITGDQRVDDALIRRRKRESCVPHRGIRIDPNPRLIAACIGIAKDHRTTRGSCSTSREQVIRRLVRPHHHVLATVLAGTSAIHHPAPRLAAVQTAEDASPRCGIDSAHVLPADENFIDIAELDRIGARQFLPCFACIARAEDSRPARRGAKYIRARKAVEPETRAGIDRVRIPRLKGQASDAERGKRVRNRPPVHASIGGFPDSASGGTSIHNSRIAGMNEQMPRTSALIAGTQCLPSAQIDSIDRRNALLGRWRRDLLVPAQREGRHPIDTPLRCFVFFIRQVAGALACALH